jgi:hypothetical protein
MSRILVPRYHPHLTGGGPSDNAGRVDAAPPRPRLRMLQPSPISREMAGKLAKRFGYTIEFWINLGTPASAVKFGPRLDAPPPQGLILPSGGAVQKAGGTPCQPQSKM